MLSDRNRALVERVTDGGSPRERPVLFGAPMVRAILEGRKTQTRRVIKDVPSWEHYGRDIMDWGLSGIHQETYDPNNPIEGTDRWHLDVQTDVDDHSRRVIRCPYGAPGDLLWVREAWCEADTPSGFAYAADAPGDPRGMGWRPSIHMPRWASRITLRITDVRVERLTDISETDAQAEGVFPAAIYGGKTASWLPTPDHRERFFETASAAFQALWEHINGPRSWEANPWVWVVAFERVTP
jgi:hypothetical protein